MDDAIDSVYLSLVMVTPLSLATRQIIVRCCRPRSHLLMGLPLSRFTLAAYSRSSDHELAFESDQAHGCLISLESKALTQLL